MKIIVKVYDANNTFLTIISCIAVFIISQLIMEFIIKPKEEFNKIKGKILCNLKMYANLIANPLEISSLEELENSKYYLDASKDIRLMASKLAGILETHPIVCNKKKYYLIVNNLIALSNGLWKNIKSNIDLYDKNEKSTTEIYKIFNVKR